MNKLVGEINKKLEEIIKELLQNKLETEESLVQVNDKITEKVEEAQEHKVSVDKAKEEIIKIEKEIKSLEEDLIELNEKFKQKDLDAIIETGTKEINAKISEKEEEIAKQRLKISELTEKARSIKDLLLNLKKDKQSKEDRLENYKQVHKYYDNSLSKIITYSTENHKNLNGVQVNYDYLKSSSISDEPTAEVFDEIASIDNSLNNVKEEPFKKPEPKKQNKKENEPVKKETIKLEESKQEKKEDQPEVKPAYYEPDYLEKLKQASKELDKLEETVNIQYDNIFGDTSTPVQEEIIKPVIDEPINIFSEEVTFEDVEKMEVPDIFGNEIVKEPTSIESFLSTYDLNYNDFDETSKQNLNNSFNEQNYKEIIEILKNNNIDLINLYNASDILTLENAQELEKKIGALLLAGQTTLNVGYVLNSLPLIDNNSLNKAIESFGQEIKAQNIADIIDKAKTIYDSNRSD